ncbi:hypothetical protein QOL99_03820 [Deinococcus sp. MIMF12]|uniref:Uncharacterized protein n=1 Tax=Deinococcus rhizophilus TaxID=3049544 RepID=A0ABT7JDY9_9DEIO|nr:hypothetical protein [Deinococcus rhizophilus]MDL2343274.1 hypothetical protein [Deinococcus rhizophilus]
MGASIGKAPDPTVTPDAVWDTRVGRAWHPGAMDFNAWRPEDTARRFSIMGASSLGTFLWIGLWLGSGFNPLLALLLGALAGVVTHLIAYPVLRALFRR